MAGGAISIMVKVEDVGGGFKQLSLDADGLRQVAFNAQATVMFGSGGAGGEHPRPTILVVYAQPSFSTFNIAESSYDTYTRTLSVRPGISFGYQQRLDWV